MNTTDILFSAGTLIAPDHEEQEEKKKRDKLWRERLSALDESEQKRIAAKYYGGKMPWKTAQ